MTAVAPADWAGPLHERPGLFARKPARGRPVEGEDEPVLLGPVHVPAHDVAPALKGTSGAAKLLNAVGGDWVYRVLAARGPVEVTVKEAGEDGKNHNVKAPRVVDSLSIRLRHPDGRAAVALWANGKFQAYAWSVCTDPRCPRWPGDHPDDHPRQIGATVLRELVRS